jgi:SAM-dependent methyltransferase
MHWDDIRAAGGRSDIQLESRHSSSFDEDLGLLSQRLWSPRRHLVATHTPGFSHRPARDARRVARKHARFVKEPFWGLNEFEYLTRGRLSHRLGRAKHGQPSHGGGGEGFDAADESRLPYGAALAGSSRRKVKMSMTPAREDHKASLRQSTDPTSNVGFQVLASLVVGAVIAAAIGENWHTARFWAATLGAALGLYLLIYYVRHYWLSPQPSAEVLVEDQKRLTSAITTSHRSAHAISSNWLDLWRTSTFRYYLHLDAVMSLRAYTFGLDAPLQTLSTDRSDQEEFVAAGWKLVEEIGRGQSHAPPHRIRLLIYPQWAYDEYGTEVLHLIRSHAAARIPCIPLVSEQLHAELDDDERDKVSKLVSLLHQTVVDKVPPLSRFHQSQARRAERRDRPSPWGVPVFPDMLLIDSSEQTASNAVWWYSGDGHVETWGKKNEQYRKLAREVFQAVCRRADQVVWANYDATNIGGVAVAEGPARLQSETFFTRHHYPEWLEWIKKESVATRRNSAASQLAAWLDAERTAISELVAQYSQGHPDKELRLVDIGCGYGRHLIGTLSDSETVRGLGVDINAKVTTEATRRAKRAKVDTRISFLHEDASELPDCDPGEFDVAICMTNTLGNMPPDKQATLMKTLGRVLKPGGQALFSVYSGAANQARLASYKDIGLDVVQDGDRITAVEGLVSMAFADDQLRSLVRDTGLKVIDIEPLSTLGLKVTVERVSERAPEVHAELATRRADA